MSTQKTLAALGPDKCIVYQEKKQPDGLQINIGPGGISVDKK